CCARRSTSIRSPVRSPPGRRCPRAESRGAVKGAEAWITQDHDVEPIATTLAGDVGGARGGGIDRRLQRGRQVDAAVEMVLRALLGPRLSLVAGAPEGLRQDGSVDGEADGTDRRTRAGASGEP